MTTRIRNIDPIGGDKELEDGTIAPHGEWTEVDDDLAKRLAEQDVWELEKPAKTHKAAKADTPQEA